MRSPEQRKPGFRLHRVLTPLRAVVLSFVLVILAGTGLLSLRAATADGSRLPFVDACFKATTSVCVTGLVVRDTGTEFSRFGEFVILCLIQLGGLGYMTTATMIAVVLGRRLGVGRQLAVQESWGEFGLHQIRPVLKRALLFTVVVEGAGAALYTFFFCREVPLPLAAWWGVFHSVSAFCNAGLDLFGERFQPFCSLAPFANEPVVVLSTAVQIVLGGLGFLVVTELLSAKRRSRLSLHARTVLVCTGLLLLTGAAVVFLLERRSQGLLSGLPVPQQLLHAFFTSVTSRTAGFSTLSIDGLHESTLVVTCFLMFVGGSPGGTAGGIKTTTLAVVLAALRATVRGDAEANLYERSLPHTLVYRAMTVFALAVGIVFLGTALLLVTEEGHLASHATAHSAALAVFFEATSAFGTVGLSTGITPTLTVAGKFILIMTMFLGRIGPVSLVAALAERERTRHIRYPEEHLPIG